MYPESLLWWLGGTAVLIGIIGLIGILAWWVDNKYQRHNKKKDNDEGRSSLWFVFEVFSAILVVTSLLVAIYSDNALLRAIAGVSLVVLVSAATVSIMNRIGDEE